MALEHAILVSLAEQSASGYDLARRFDRSIGFFWTATHQQIYKVLARMEADEHVSAALVAQDGRPDKKVYTVTDEGYAELLRWSRVPTTPVRPRSDLAVKVRGLPYADRDAVLADLARTRDSHRERLAYYLANEAKNYPDPSALSGDELAAYLVLRGGVRLERSQAEWCEEMLEVLR